VALPDVEFRVLGPFEVLVGGRPVPIGSRKQRLVLSALTVEVDRVVGADALSLLLWDDVPPSSADVTLRSLVSRVRRALGGSGGCLEGRDGGYRLRVDPAQVDGVRFERGVVQARDQLAAGRSEEAASTLRDMLGLWRGPAYCEIADRDFGRPAAHRLDEARADAVEELAEAEIASGEWQQALAVLEPHLAAHPLRERPWEQLMLALYRSGRQAEALAAYRRVRALLRDELGVEPNPALRTLERRILNQDPRLAAVAEHVGAARTAEPVAELPVPLTALVGRAAELAELARVLTRTRLLTLTGVGGVGKTRLALQLARNVECGFAGGVRLVELGTLMPDAGEARWAVAAEVASGLDVASAGATDAEEVLRRVADRLRGRPALLLVLDNCEHVVDAVARFVHGALQRCSELTVLITSREPLAVPGEVVWAVPPLALPPAGTHDLVDLAAGDAVALFCQRAGAAQAGFTLTVDNAPAVERICRRLDGIPLALELAAARMRALGPDQVAARLDSRFELLTAGGRTALPRQQTLRATMDWSYRLLSGDEQVVLRRLTVFAAPFDLDAAEAVAGPEDGPAGTVADVVFRLVDKSVVVAQQRRGEVRFGLLESVRAYAAERLAEAGEGDAVRRRLRMHYTAAAAQQRRVWGSGWDSTGWHRRVAAEEDNFRAAVSAALAGGDHDAALLLLSGLWVHWIWAGRAEAIGWLEGALKGPGRDLVARTECTIGLASLLRWWELGEPERSVRLFAEAEELAEAADDDGCRFWARYFHAEFLMLRGEGERAKARYLEALRWAAPRSSVGWCSYCFGWLAMGEGDAAAARAEFERAVSLAGRDHMLRPHALAALAPLLALAGEASAAEETAAAAVASAREFPLPGVLVMALVRAAQAQVLCRADTAAEDTVVELFDLMHRLGTLQFRAEAFEVVAVLTGRAGDLRGAARLLGTASAEIGRASCRERV